MVKATRDITKKKRAAQPGTPVLVRLQPDQLAALDRWIDAQSKPKPSRPEALRRLLGEAISGR